MTDNLIITQSEHILRIRFDRPAKKNALNLAMYRQLADALNDANSNNDIRVAYIDSTSDVFCSGNDLQDFLNNPLEAEVSPVYSFMMALMNFEKPVVAAVSGLAVGIGTTLLLHCDLVYANKSAVFSLPFVNLGVCAEFGSSLLLPLLCGHQRACEAILCGDPFSANDAKEIGLINSVTTNADLEATALTKAKKIAQQPIQSTKAIKQQLKAPFKDQLDQLIVTEFELFTELLEGEESKQILSAFIKS